MFATWLMVSTFSYDSEKNSILIGSRLWSDFGAHIPLIRSFSLGDNLDRLLMGKMPEYPLFPGEPIRYHFLFFAFVGVLEKIGLRIDWALNLLSILGFFLLMSLIYSLASKIFQDYRVGLLSLIFFLFNGSLSFLRFFELHPLSLTTPFDVWHAKDFPAFAPWGPGDITAFWNLNIYTNQRHLAFAFGLGLGFIATLIAISEKPLKKQFPIAVLWGLLIGALPFLHQPTLLIVALFGGCYILFFPKLRMPLLVIGSIAGLCIFLQYPYIPRGENTLTYYPGYLLHDTLTSEISVIEKVLKAFFYWFQNLGGHIILAPIGFIISNNRIKKIFIPLLLLFIIPNVLRFSVEVAASHKFFNFFLIMASMLTAFVMVQLFDSFKKHIRPQLRLVSYTVFCLIIFFLTLSGIIDFFVVENDHRGEVADIKVNPIARWIVDNTPKDAVFLNSHFFFHPASLAGRKIFLGWPYFSWSAGYTEQRGDTMKILYESKDVSIFCPLLTSHNISFITVEDTSSDSNLPVIDVAYYQNNFPVRFERIDPYLGIFSTSDLCSQVI